MQCLLECFVIDSRTKLLGMFYGLAQNWKFFDQIHSELSFFNMAKKRSNESKNSANGQRKSMRIIGAPVASIAVEQPRIDVLNGKKGKEPHKTQVSLALTPSTAKRVRCPMITS